MNICRSTTSWVDSSRSEGRMTRVIFTTETTMHLQRKEIGLILRMDKVDKSGLPSVLQKRRGEFGKKG